MWKSQTHPVWPPRWYGWLAQSLSKILHPQSIIFNCPYFFCSSHAGPLLLQKGLILLSLFTSMKRLPQTPAAKFLYMSQPALEWWMTSLLKCASTPYANCVIKQHSSLPPQEPSHPPVHFPLGLIKGSTQHCNRNTNCILTAGTSQWIKGV